MDRQTMIDRIKALMAERGLTPKLLSRMIGAGPTYVRDILEGRSQQPSALRLQRMAIALGVDLETLVGATNGRGLAEAAMTIAAAPQSPSAIVDDDVAFADVSEAVAAMLRDEGAPADVRSVARMSLVVWRDIMALPASLPFSDRLEFTLSERRSAVRTAQAAMYQRRTGVARE